MPNKINGIFLTGLIIIFHVITYFLEAEVVKEFVFQVMPLPEDVIISPPIHDP